MFEQDQIGLFSPNGGDIINQDFFDAAFAGRVHADPIYKEAYFCNLIGECNMSQWIEEYMGYEVDCNPAYSLIERATYNHQVEVKTAVTIPVAPTTAIIALASASHYVSGVYVLPQVGNTLVAKNGLLLDVTAVTVTTANNTTVTVKQRDANAIAFDLAVGEKLMVLAGARIEDCACPDGQFSFPDLPIIHDVEMDQWGDKGDLCGDALDKCQYLKIPFTDEKGNTVSKWYVEPLKLMYQRHEKRKYYERLFNPNWGLIPVIKTRGLHFQTASTTEVTVDDIKQWARDLVAAGIMQTEFAIFAGIDSYIQWQDLLGQTGVDRLNYVLLGDGCKWINMEYCGIKVAGLTLHIYKDCTFSNGKELGDGFSNSFIVVPLWEREKARGFNDNKMLTTVYFKSEADGKVFDNLTDSNGILGTRNTFGVGCRQQEWSIQSRFLQEVHCPNAWGHGRLPVTA